MSTMPMHHDVTDRAPHLAEPITTLDGVVRLVSPYLPPELLGAPDEPPAAALAAVPVELVARFALECRLGAGEPAAGVLFSADSETGGMQMLAGRHPLVRMPDELAASPAWAPAVRFCAARRPGFLLHRATRDVWVDMARSDSPSFSFGMRMSGAPEATRRPLEVLARALELGFEALRGEPAEAATQASMRALLQALPDTARVAFAGRTAEAPGAMRLWLVRLQPAELVALVRDARGDAEAGAVGALLERLRPAGGGIGARVDVGDGLGARLAIVLTVDPTGSPRQVAARWRPLLDRLVTAGLCTESRREALLAGWGLLRERQAERWPAHLTRLSEMLGEGTESYLRWRLHHLTVECEGGRPVGALASLVVGHGWSRRSR